MKTGRFINRLDKNNILQYLGTQGFDQLLTRENMQSVWNATSSGENVFKDDLAITNTIITPDFDGSRVIYANDTIITKFEAADLFNFLTPDEKAILLQRANQTYNLTARMQNAQHNNGVELKNPLPSVQL